MQDLQLIEKKEISDIEIKDNEAETVEIEELPKTQEDIINELKERVNHLIFENMRVKNRASERLDEIQWIKRYMKEKGLDFENEFKRWKENTIRRDRADYEKYGEMRPEQRREYDERLERVREEMRRRRAQK